MLGSDLLPLPVTAQQSPFPACREREEDSLSLFTRWGLGFPSPEGVIISSAAASAPRYTAPYHTYYKDREFSWR